MAQAQLEKVKEPTIQAPIRSEHNPYNTVKAGYQKYLRRAISRTLDVSRDEIKNSLHEHGQSGAASTMGLAGGGIGAVVGFLGGYLIVGSVPGHIIQVLTTIPFVAIGATVGFTIGYLVGGITKKS
jgi:hypothetical protein